MTEPLAAPELAVSNSPSIVPHIRPTPNLIETPVLWLQTLPAVALFLQLDSYVVDYQDGTSHLSQR